MNKIILYFFVLSICTSYSFGQTVDDYKSNEPDIFHEPNSSKKTTSKNKGTDDGENFETNKNGIYLNMVSFTRGFYTLGYERAFGKVFVLDVSAGPSFKNIFNPPTKNVYYVNKKGFASEITLKMYGNKNGPFHKSFLGFRALYFTNHYIASADSVVSLANSNYVGVTYGTYTQKIALSSVTTELTTMYGYTINKSSHFVFDFYIGAGLKINLKDQLIETNEVMGSLKYDYYRAQNHDFKKAIMRSGFRMGYIF